MRESRQEIVQVQPGLHDPRFLPSGDVGIDRPEAAGRRHQLASMKLGFSRRVRAHRARQQAAAGAERLTGCLEGHPNISKKEILQ